MSHLRWYASKGFGEAAVESYGYNQAVRVGDTIHLSGQGNRYHTHTSPFHLADVHHAMLCMLGGWHPETFKLPTDINAQTDQACANVDLNLKTAGSKGGWAHVYKVRSYHIPLNEEAKRAMVRNFRAWMPDHHPLWTCVQVGRLGEDDMRVEIEVEAHDPEWAKAE